MTPSDARVDRGVERLPWPIGQQDGDGLGLEELWRLCESVSDPPRRDPLEGNEIGGVLIERLIGEGGMGRVYAGTQRQPHRRVAVKVLRQALPSLESTRRFLAESIILAQLSHPGIASIFSAGSSSVAGVDVPYIVMEHVPGANSITDFVAAQGLPLDAVLALFHDACVAVGHGHSRGVVHRDLKPENILVDATGRPKIIDFGVASAAFADHVDIRLTRTGQLVGTLQYMSPEQLRGEKSVVDPTSDVYSLGVVLYELLTGVPPYDLSQADMVDAVTMIAEREPAPLGPRMANPSPELESIVGRCLHKDRSERFADAAELAQAIAAFRHRWADGHGRPEIMAGTAVAAGSRKPGALVSWRILVAALSTLIPVSGFGAAIAIQRAAVAPADIDEGFARVATAGAPVFAYGIRDVFDLESDRHVVECAGVRRFERSCRGVRIGSWVPERAGIEGRMVFRFDFPRPVRRVDLRASFTCFNGESEADANGFCRGAAAVEVSTDGQAWQCLVDHIATSSWGRNWGIDGSVAGDTEGTERLWVRVRLLCDSDTLIPFGAEFCRSAIDSVRDVLRVTAYAN